jgi:lysophospholipase L1-like esterase
MRARDRGRAFGRIVALGAALAVICTAAPATATAEPVAQRQQQPQQPQQKRVFKIVVVGDSFSAGEGVHDSGFRGKETNAYVDAQDPRHQSKLSAAMQAAARLQEANPDLQVEVHVVAASGAATEDMFVTQRRDPLETIPGNKPQSQTDQSTWHDPNDLAVNGPQLDQIPEDADAVIVGLGGNDVFFAPMIRSLAPMAADDTESILNRAKPLLDADQPDQTYRDQAGLDGDTSYAPGQEPTLVARLLRVMKAIQGKAKNAKLFFQNYPMAVDPDATSSVSPLSADDLRAMQQYGERVNKAIKRAMEICGCADLVDLSNALQGHELYKKDSGMNDLGKAFPGVTRDTSAWEGNEAGHPNRAGAGYLADHIAESLAKRFGLKVPSKQGSRKPDVSKLKFRNTPAPDTDKNGVPDYKDKDWDGDGIPNTKDATPNTPNPVQPKKKSEAPRGTTGQREGRPSDGRQGPSGQGPTETANRGTTRTADATAQPGPAQPPQRENSSGGKPTTQPATPPRQETDPGGRPATQPATPPRQDNNTGSGKPVTPPQQDNNNSSGKPATPPQQGTNTGKPPASPTTGSGSTPKPTSTQTVKRPAYQEPAAMRSTTAPSVPKPPTAPRFQPNFGPPGSPAPSQIGGGLLGVTPPPLVVYKPPAPPSIKTPLGGSRPKTPPSTTPYGPPAPPPPPPPPPPAPSGPSGSFVGV